jgi:hypothetical protein
VPQSWTQGLGDLAKVGVGALGTHLNDESMKGLAAKDQGILADAVQQYLSRTKEQPAVPPSTLGGPTAPSMSEVPPASSPSAQEQVAAALGPPPDQSNLPQTIPNTIQPTVGGTGLITNPAEKATPPIPSYANLSAQSGQALPPQEQVAQALAQQQASMQGPMSPGTPGRPRTPDERQQALIELMASPHPKAAHIGQFLAQQQGAQDEKATQRNWMHQETRDKIDAKLESDKNHIDLLTGLKIMSMEEGAKAKKDADERHASLLTQLNKSTTETSRANNADTNAARIEAAKIAADAKLEVQGMKSGPGAKALPGSIGSKFMENSQNLRMAERAKGLIEGQTVEGTKGDPNATGMKSYLPDMLLQRTDPGGVETRAAVANLGSMIIHDRSGAAVTASEYPRLRPFIPTATDDPGTVKKKLGQFINEYQKINDEMTQFYTESGYHVPESGWHQSPELTVPTTQGKPNAFQPFHDPDEEKAYQQWKLEHK